MVEHRDRLMFEVPLHTVTDEALYTDGAELLYDDAESGADTEVARAEALRLVVARSGPRIFTPITHEWLRRSEYGPTAMLS